MNDEDTTKPGAGFGSKVVGVGNVVTAGTKLRLTEDMSCYLERIPGTSSP